MGTPLSVVFIPDLSQHVGRCGSAMDIWAVWSGRCSVHLSGLSDALALESVEGDVGQYGGFGCGICRIYAGVIAVGFRTVFGGAANLVVRLVGLL